MLLRWTTLAAFILLPAPLRGQDYGLWHVLGSFDHPAGAANIDAPGAPERELKRLDAGGGGPDLAATYDGKGKAEIRWQPLALGALGGHAPDVGLIDLIRCLKPPSGVQGWHERAVAYLYRRIDAPHAMEIQVAVGSNDGLRLWFNGGLLIDLGVPRALNTEDHTLTLRLRPGANHILAKVAQGDTHWQFRMAPWNRIPQEAIDKAIDRGVEWMVKSQLLDGTWAYRDDHGAGHAAFAAYTLLKCGVEPDHPAVRMALQVIRDRPWNTTYAASCVVLCVEALHDPTWSDEARRAVELLLSFQQDTGVFSYPSDAPEDLSNTLYAALAFRAAERLGIDVPDAAWKGLATGTLRYVELQQEMRTTTGRDVVPAGFGYHPGGGPTGSTTTAGISILAMADEATGGRLPPAIRTRMHGARLGGLAWIDRQMRWYDNPGAGPSHHYFWIYGLERVGMLLDREILGGIDWYWNGASYLVRAQRGDGAWVGPWEDQAPVDTLLALLFLRRTTQPVTGGVEGVARKAPVTGEKRAPVDPGGWVQEDAAAALTIRARGELPTTVWLRGLRADCAGACASAVDQKLSIERVEFLARLVGEDGAPTVVASVPGLRVLPTELHRFAARAELTRAGEWALSARAVLLVEARDDAPAVERVFESPELVVKIRGLLEPERLAYARDPFRNLLRSSAPQVATSSASSEGHAGAQAVDGAMHTWWQCAPQDREPWIRLSFEKPLRVDRLLLAHAQPRLGRRGDPRAARVVVRVDGRDEHPLEIRPDVMLKTTLDFGRTLLVNELEIRIVETRGGELGRLPFGFSEIELQKSEASRAEPKKAR